MQPSFAKPTTLFLFLQKQVPVFAFGQSKAFSWWRPPGVQSISRKLQAVPLAIWGAYGTPIPHAAPIHVVIGKPIEVGYTELPAI